MIAVIDKNMTVNVTRKYLLELPLHQVLVLCLVVQLKTTVDYWGLLQVVEEVIHSSKDYQPSHLNKTIPSLTVWAEAAIEVGAG
jgi:hypothetical protein